MARLEDPTRGAQMKGIRADGPVEVVDAKWFGSGAVEPTFKDAQGRPGNEPLYRTDEPRLELHAKGPTWNFDADGDANETATALNKPLTSFSRSCRSTAKPPKPRATSAGCSKKKPTSASRA